MTTRPNASLELVQKHLQSTFTRIRQAPSHQKSGGFDNVLSKALRKSTGTAPAQRTGLTLADYRANPVHSFPTRKKNTPPAAETAKAGSPSSITNNTGELSKISNQERIASCVNKAAKNYRLSPQLIKAVIKAESNYQVSAVSPAGAQGLMQLMPGTAADLGVTDPFDIEQNIDGGARYLRKMLDMFDGNERLALAAYNAGPGTVMRYGDIPPYRETHDYVERVLNNRG